MTKDKLIRQIQQFDPSADLHKFPPIIYSVKHSSTSNIKIGEKLPDELLDLPLWIVNGDEAKDVVTLRAYSDKKLIVLDFWSKFCAPCIESVDKWEVFANSLGDSLQLLPVQIDYDYKAVLMANSRDWRSPIIIGRSAYLLNSYFFDRQVISRLAWIKDGKLIAITGTKGYGLQLVKDVAEGKVVDIPMAYEWTYSQKNI